MIKIQNLNKSFKKAVVLQDINLEIADGEVVVLSGVSGSGKSTLLSIIGAILKPTSGVIEVDSENIASLSDYHLSEYRSKRVGFVTQAFHLFDMLSVSQNIVPALLLGELSQSEIRERVFSVMKLASIEHKKDEVASNLSGGEKQRCMIARALVNSPKILLCDEPTANLDRTNSLKFIEIIKELKESGKTIIIATHDPLISELELVDRVIKIDEGKIE